MQPRHWRFRIEDILGAVERIERYTAGLDYEEFLENDMAVDAVIRNLEIIGEAARFIPPEVEARHPHVPWRKMRETRNVMIHHYFGVSLSIVWETIQESLPPLVPMLQAVLEAEDTLE